MAAPDRLCVVEALRLALGLCVWDALEVREGVPEELRVAEIERDCVTVALSVGEGVSVALGVAVDEGVKLCVCEAVTVSVTLGDCEVDRV